MPTGANWGPPGGGAVAGGRPRGPGGGAFSRWWARDLCRALTGAGSRPPAPPPFSLSPAPPPPPPPLPADLNAAAGEAVAFLQPEAGRRHIRLTFLPHPGGAPARLDPSQIGRASCRAR